MQVDGRTDRYDKPNGRFRNFANTPLNMLCILKAPLNVNDRKKGKERAL
jgi:hypothetical protein